MAVANYLLILIAFVLAILSLMSIIVIIWLIFIDDNFIGMVRIITAIRGWQVLGMSPIGTVSIDILMFGDRIVRIYIGDVIIISTIVPGWPPDRLIADIDTNASAHGSRVRAVERREKYTGGYNGTIQEKAELVIFHS